jgi:hypothetical protein
MNLVSILIPLADPAKIPVISAPDATIPSFFLIGTKPMPHHQL